MHSWEEVQWSFQEEGGKLASEAANGPNVHGLPSELVPALPSAHLLDPMASLVLDLRSSKLGSKGSSSKFGSNVCSSKLESDFGSSKLESKVSSSKTGAGLSKEKTGRAGTESSKEAAPLKTHEAPGHKSEDMATHKSRNDRNNTGELFVSAFGCEWQHVFFHGPRILYLLYLRCLHTASHSRTHLTYAAHSFTYSSCPTYRALCVRDSNFLCLPTTVTVVLRVSLALCSETLKTLRAL